MLNLRHVRRHRRTREDKLPKLPPLIHLKPHRIPYARLLLPFIQQHGGFPLQQSAWRCVQQVADMPPHVRVIEVQLAARHLRRRCRLSAPLRALHQHRSTRFQLSLQHFIRYPRSVCSSFHSFLFPFIIRILPIMSIHFYLFWTIFIIYFGQNLLLILDKIYCFFWIFYLPSLTFLLSAYLFLLTRLASHDRLISYLNKASQ